MAKLCELKVVAPVPWFPPLKLFKKWYKFSQIPFREEIDGLEVYHPRFIVLPKIGRSLYGFLYFLAVVPLLKRIAKEYPFDHLDVHWAYPDGFAGILLAKLLKKTVSITVRGVDIISFTRYSLLRRLIVYALKRADLTIAVCDDLKRRVLDLGVGREKVVTVSNGVDVDRFYMIEKISTREALKLPLEKTIILSVGHLIERKGFHYLIEAVSKIVTAGRKDILLLVIGEGEYRPILERQIENLGLSDFVRLMGAKSHTELYKWYSAADLFCLVSNSEGWANVILEALATGTPVVATAVGGLPEIIPSEEYGILVEDQDVGKLARAIERALDKEWETGKLIAYAQENSWNKCAGKVLERIEAIASS
ncbi:MAG: glycosyltransferase family 4 protein [bacterium]